MINHRRGNICFSAFRYSLKQQYFLYTVYEQAAAPLPERALVESNGVNSMHLYDIWVLWATFTIATLILPKHN